MTTYTGRQTVKAGIYLNTKTYHIETLNQTGELPGVDLDTYRRIPMLVMLAAAPLIGLAFVMFLPLIGFAMMLHLVGTKVLRAVTGAATKGVRVTRPSWVPAMAFLHRAKHATPEKTAENPAAENPTDAWTEDVEKKLNNDDDAKS